MPTETRSFVDIFFNYYDATNWLEKHLIEFSDPHPEYTVKEAEIKLMPSGGYRVGLVLEKRQMELF